MGGNIADIAAVILLTIVLVILIIPGILMFLGFLVDRSQKRHAVLRNYPLIGRVRYFLESIGPELRQ